METKQGAIGWILSCEETTSKRKMNFTFSVPNMSNRMVKKKKKNPFILCCKSRLVKASPTLYTRQRSTILFQLGFFFYSHPLLSSVFSNSCPLQHHSIWWVSILHSLIYSQFNSTSLLQHIKGVVITSRCILKMKKKHLPPCTNDIWSVITKNL